MNPQHIGTPHQTHFPNPYEAVVRGSNPRGPTIGFSHITIIHLLNIVVSRILDKLITITTATSMPKINASILSPISYVEGFKKRRETGETNCGYGGNF